MTRLLPDTLFGQLWLSLSALLLASSLLSLGVFRKVFVDPSARHLGTLMADQCLLLTLAQPHPEFNAQSLHGVHLATHLPVEADAQPDLYYLRSLTQTLNAQLGAQAKLRLQRQPQPTLWVQLPAAQMRWVGFDLARFEHGMLWFLSYWLLLLSGGSLLGAYWLAHHFTQPLRQLAQAAEALGRHQAFPELQPGGTHELRILQQAFTASARSLEQVEADRNLLLAGISHDLRTPLTRMRLALEFDQDETLLQGLLQDIAEMEQTINQFIDFVRGATEEPAQPTDLNALVTALAARYTRAPPLLSLAPLPLLNLRPLALRRLLSNLLDNAYRHGQGEVQLGTTPQAGGVLLTVQDRGPGLPEAWLQTALQPYTRLDSARGTPGSGLGLAIVERVARLHGGTVTLTNRAGGGLTVGVYLP